MTKATRKRNTAPKRKPYAVSLAFMQLKQLSAVAPQMIADGYPNPMLPIMGAALEQKTLELYYEPHARFAEKCVRFGSKITFWPESGRSALPPKVDLGAAAQKVWTPKPDIRWVP